MQELYKQLKQFGKVKLNEPLSKHTTFKIGGSAGFFVIVDDSKKIFELLKLLDGKGQQYFVLGGGSNILVGDEGIKKVVIQINNKELSVNGIVIEAGAGCSLVEVAQKSTQNGLTGFEWGVGVPGTIGGAVRGNAGCMGKEMKDSMKWVEVYRDGEVVKMTNEECEFSYRHSIFKENNFVIIKVCIGLQKSEDKNGVKKLMENIKYRSDTQPKGFSCAGCVFKNYPLSPLQATAGEANYEFGGVKIPDEFIKNKKIPAGWLVEQVGMKGVRIGKAQVSDKHGNFILNTGGATASDVLQLIAVIKEKVYNTFGIELKEEIQIIQ